MKTNYYHKSCAFRVFASLVFMGFLGQVWSQGNNQEDKYSSFEDPGYTKPVATVLGTMMNSGWYQSARVGKNFGFQISAPITLAYLSNKDRRYHTLQPTDCDRSREIQAQSPNQNFTSCNDPDYLSYAVPTVFGPSAGDLKFKKHILLDNGEPTGQFIEGIPGGGMPDLRNFGTLPFIIPQIAFSINYTELKIRYLPVPLSFINTSGNIFGFSLQHDLGSFMKQSPMLMSVGISLSTWGIDFTPTGFTGSLDMSGLTSFTGIIMGKQFGFFEAFFEAGWETASMDLGGRIVDEDDPQNIQQPDLSVKGRNGFRIAFNASMHFGYHPVVGQNIGSQISNQLNLLIFKKESD